MEAKAQYNILYNSRFYILSFSLLLSISIFALLRLSIESDQLLLIRLQQIYGLACLLLLYVALIISPIGSLVGKERIKHANFSRRAIGVSAFFFGFLDGCIALFGQLGGASQLQFLPELFKWSLSFGLIALFVLFLLAVTSFDRVISFMTFRRWKWLHRFVYVSGALLIIHVWTVGTHFAYSWAQVGGFVALGVLLGLESIRMTRTLNQKYLRRSRAEAATIAIAVWAMCLVMVAAMPVLVQNYHSRHTDHSHGGEQ